jgi:hypothetical protein
MTHQYHRSKPEGRIHRARLRQLVLPTLRVGSRLPKLVCLAALLGIHESEASRHLHRMLAEAGIATETRGRAGIFVVSLQEWREAA